MVKGKCFSKKSNEQSELACLQSFFGGRAKVFDVGRHVDGGYLYSTQSSSVIKIKDGGYNDELSPAQNTPVLQAKCEQAKLYSLCYFYTERLERSNMSSIN